MPCYFWRGFLRAVADREKERGESPSFSLLCVGISKKHDKNSPKGGNGWGIFFPRVQAVRGVRGYLT